MSDNILVAIRIRPLIAREINNAPVVYWTGKGNSITEKDPNSTNDLHTYYYDLVYNQDSNNNHIFQTLAYPIVESAVSGINGTIFAYGQTSSGKTYTMAGDKNELGVIPLAIETIFELIENIPDREFLLRGSYMEIYQENINDLLTGDRISNLQEDPSGQVIIPDLKEVCVTNGQMLLTLIENGDKRRKVGETKMNERSSRSHSIFRLIIESRRKGDNDCEEGVVVSHLNLVDLAGSENASQTGAVGKRLKEGGSINKSLFMLGRVISQLSNGEQFISFRDSKLTRILQHSLGGNAKTAMVCNVTPVNKEQTHSTLRFASRVKSIKNKPIVNEVLSDSALLKRYAMEIKQLRNALESARSTDRAQEVEQVKEKLEEQEKKNIEMELMMKTLKEKLVVSSLDYSEKKSKDKLRRVTWAAPASRRARFSLAPLPKTPLWEDSFAIPSDFDNSSNDGNWSRFSNESEISSDVKTPDDILEEGANLKENFTEHVFLSPKPVPKRRKKKEVCFLQSSGPLLPPTVDVECQTDESLLPISRTVSTQDISVLAVPESPYSNSSTPKATLRQRNSYLADCLKAKDLLFSGFKEELEMEKSFYRNDINFEIMDSPIYKELQNENAELRISLQEKSDLVVELTHKLDNLHSKGTQIASVESANNLRSTMDTPCTIPSGDPQIESLTTENLQMKKELHAKGIKLKELEKQNVDLDTSLHLALAKHKENEKYLRDALSEAWSDLDLAKDGENDSSSKMSQFLKLTEDLEFFKVELQNERKEKRALEEKLASLPQEPTVNDSARERFSFDAFVDEDNSFKEALSNGEMDHQDTESPLAFKFKIPQIPRRYSEVPCRMNSISKTKAHRRMSEFTPKLDFNTSICNISSEISRKLTETLQSLDESLLGSSPQPDNEEIGVTNKELEIIKEQLLNLQEMLMLGNTCPNDQACSSLSIDVDQYEICTAYNMEMDSLLLLENICADFISYSRLIPDNSQELPYTAVSETSFTANAEAQNTEIYQCSSPEMNYNFEEHDVTESSTDFMAVQNDSKVLSLEDELKMAALNNTSLQNASIHVDNKVESQPLVPQKNYNSEQDITTGSTDFPSVQNDSKVLSLELKTNIENEQLLVEISSLKKQLSSLPDQLYVEKSSKKMSNTTKSEALESSKTDCNSSETDIDIDNRYGNKEEMSPIATAELEIIKTEEFPVKVELNENNIKILEQDKLKFEELKNVVNKYEKDIESYEGYKRDTEEQLIILTEKCKLYQEIIQRLEQNKTLSINEESCKDNQDEAKHTERIYNMNSSRPSKPHIYDGDIDNLNAESIRTESIMVDSSDNTIDMTQNESLNKDKDLIVSTQNGESKDEIQDSEKSCVAESICSPEMRYVISETSKKVDECNSITSSETSETPRKVDECNFITSSIETQNCQDKIVYVESLLESFGFKEIEDLQKMLEKYSHLNDENEELKGLVNEFDIKCSNLEISKEKSFDVLKSEILECKEIEEKLNLEIKLKEEIIDSLNNDMFKLKEESEYSNRTISALEKQKESLANKLKAEFSDEIDCFKYKLEDKEKELRILLEKLDARCEVEINTSSHKSDMNEFKSEDLKESLLCDEQLEESECDAEMDILKQTIQSLNENMSTLKEECVHYCNKVLTLEQLQLTKDRDLKCMSDEIHSQKSVLEEKETEIDSLLKKSKELEETLAQKQTELDSLISVHEKRVKESNSCEDISALEQLLKEKDEYADNAELKIQRLEKELELHEQTASEGDAKISAMSGENIDIKTDGMCESEQMKEINCECSAEIDDLKQVIQALNDNMSTLKEECEHYCNKVLTLEELQVSKENDFKNLSEEVHTQKCLLEEKEVENNLLMSKSKEFEEILAQKQTELDLLISVHEKKVKEKESNGCEDIYALEQLLKEKDENSCNAELKIQRLEKELELHNQTALKGDDKISAVSGENIDIKTDVMFESEQRKEMNCECSAEIDNLKQTIQLLNLNVSTLKEECENYCKNILTLEELYVSKENDFKSLSEEVNTQKCLLEEKETEIDSLLKKSKELELLAQKQTNLDSLISVHENRVKERGSNSCEDTSALVQLLKEKDQNACNAELKIQRLEKELELHNQTALKGDDKISAVSGENIDIKTDGMCESEQRKEINCECNAEIDNLKQTIQLLNLNVSTFKEECEHYCKNILTLEELYVSKENDFKSLSEEVNTQKCLLEEKETEIDSLLKKSKELEELLAQKQTNLDSLISVHEKRVKERGSNSCEDTSALVQLLKEKDQNACNAELKIQRLEKELELHNQTALKGDDKISAVSGENIDIKTDGMCESEQRKEINCECNAEIDNLKQTIQLLNLNVSTFKEECEHYCKNILTLEELYVSKENDFKSLSEEVNTQKCLLEEKETEMNSLLKKSKELEETLAQKQTELDSLITVHEKKVKGSNSCVDTSELEQLLKEKDENACNAELKIQRLEKELELHKQRALEVDAKITAMCGENIDIKTDVMCESEQMKEKNCECSAEINEFKQTIQALNENMSTLKEECEHYCNKALTLEELQVSKENDFKNLSEEVHTQKIVLEEKETEIDSLLKKSKELEETIAEKQTELDSMLAVHEKKIKEIETKNCEEITAYEQLTKEKDELLCKADLKVKDLEKELELLKQTALEGDTNLSDLIEQNMQIKSKLSAVQVDYEILQSQQRELQILLNGDLHNDSICENIVENFTKWRNTYDDLEKENLNLNSQCQSLSKTLKDNEGFISTLKTDIDNFKKIQEEHDVLKTDNLKLTLDLENLLKENNSKEEELTYLRTENEALKVDYDNLHMDGVNLLKANEEALVAIQEKDVVIKCQEESLNELKEAHSNCIEKAVMKESDINDLLTKIEKYENEAVSYEVKLEKIQLEYDTVMKECNNKLEKVFEEYQLYNNYVNDGTDLSYSVNASIDILIKKFEETSTKLTNIEDDLKLKETETNTLKSKIVIMENNAKKDQIFEQEISEMKEKKKQLEMEHERYENEIRESGREKQMFKDEIESIHIENKHLIKENIDLKTKITHYQLELVEKEGQMDGEILTLQDQLKIKEKELVSSKLEADDTKKQYEELNIKYQVTKEELDALENYNKELLRGIENFKSKVVEQKSSDKEIIKNLMKDCQEKQEELSNLKETLRIKEEEVISSKEDAEDAIKKLNNMKLVSQMMDEELDTLEEKNKELLKQNEELKAVSTGKTSEESVKNLIRDCQEKQEELSHLKETLRIKEDEVISSKEDAEDAVKKLNNMKLVSQMMDEELDTLEEKNKELLKQNEELKAGSIGKTSEESVKNLKRDCQEKQEELSRLKETLRIKEEEVISSKEYAEDAVKKLNNMKLVNQMMDEELDTLEEKNKELLKQNEELKAVSIGKTSEESNVPSSTIESEVQNKCIQTENSAISSDSTLNCQKSNQNLDFRHFGMQVEQTLKDDKFDQRIKDLEEKLKKALIEQRKLAKENEELKALCPGLEAFNQNQNLSSCSNSSSESKDLSAEDFRVKYFEFKNENTVLKWQLKTMSAPFNRKIDDIKAELRSEREKSKKLVNDVKRLHDLIEDERRQHQAAAPVDSKSPVVSAKAKSPEKLISHCSGVVMESRVWHLENAMYSLNKEKSVLENERDYYKNKATEWKTKCLRGIRNSSSTKSESSLTTSTKDTSGSHPKTNSGSEVTDGLTYGKAPLQAQRTNVSFPSTMGTEDGNSSISSDVKISDSSKLSSSKENITPKYKQYDYPQPYKKYNN